jgi:hypothetical protein
MYVDTTQREGLACMYACIRVHTVVQSHGNTMASDSGHGGKRRRDVNGCMHVCSNVRRVVEDLAHGCEPGVAVNAVAVDEDLSVGRCDWRLFDHLDL